MLNQARDDAQLVPEIGETIITPVGRAQKEGATGGGTKGGGKRKGIPLEELTRFTMVKRIW